MFVRFVSFLKCFQFKFSHTAVVLSKFNANGHNISIRVNKKTVQQIAAMLEVITYIVFERY